MAHEPFLVRFARVVPYDDSNSEDIATESGDGTENSQIRMVGTIFTKVDRETTDDQ